MASLTENLTLLKNGKQKLINEVNNKLDTADKEELPIDCEWTEIIDLMDKIKVKEDHSEEIDSNEIYSELCEGTYNKDIVTNVTNIPSYSFYYQEYLPKITGEHVTTIGQYAFYNCSSLTEINFPLVKTIETYAFANCTDLMIINCPEVTQLGTRAFNNIGSATVIMPKLAAIGTRIFQDSKIVLGQFNLTTSVGSYAFYNSKLRQIYLPVVQTIGSYAFKNCTELVQISLPEDNTYTIATEAFNNCPQLETDVTKNAAGIDPIGIVNTKIIAMNSNTLTSLNYDAIKDNSILETINFTNITDHISSSSSIVNNASLRTISLPKLNRVCALVKDCSNLESIYLPEVLNIGSTSGSGTIINNCAKIESLVLPNADYFYYAGSYSCVGGIVADCQNITTLDLSNIKTYGSTYGNEYNYWLNSNTEYLAYNCKQLRNINLAKLQYCYKTKGYSPYSNGTTGHFKLFNKVGITSQNLPSLTWVNPYVSSCLFVNCYDLSEVNMPNLEDISLYRYYAHISVIIGGCPNLESIILPKLNRLYYPRNCFCSYHDTGAGDDENNCLYYTKPYIEAKLRYYKDNVANYLTNNDYRRWYERRYGGFADSSYDYNTVSPWNSGMISGQQYNYSWCGLKKIELPKLTSVTTARHSSYYDYWAGDLCDCCTELEELWLGDGTSDFNSTLTARFTKYCINLKKVILNYTNVVPINAAVTDVFMYSDYLTGTSRYIPDTGVDGTKYYYSNPSGIKACYFYVPDNLVDAYKSATNWATYADYIRPLSELFETVIDPSITVIEDNQFKDDQTLTTMSGYGITDVGNHAFDNTSATRLEFVFAKNIGSYAFANSTNLTKLIISYNEMTSVAEGTFMNTPLNVINVNSAVTIDKYAFKNCSELGAVSISKTKYINEEAFNNCTSLLSVSTPEIILVKDKAFKGCSSLNSIVMENLKTIESETFMNCNINNLNLPNVTTIKESAFENNNLTSISIPNIAIIKDRAFAGNSNLTSINLYNIMSIGNNVFDGCDNLTSITFTNYSVPDHGNIPTTCTLHVRPELVTEFETEFPNNTIVGDVE